MTTKINHFDKNVTITHIGGLFKGSLAKIWSINVQCSPKQEKKFTNFSNAAMLIRGKKLNCNERQLSHPNMVIALSEQNQLIPSFLRDFIELSTDPKLEYFEGIQTSFILKRPSQVTVHIPQFELARTLFLINSYFCRASLSTTTIQHEFEVITNDDGVEIVFLENNTMPLKLVRQKGTQSLLAWLLLDPNAKQSFESICLHFNTQLKDENGWKKWIFRFDPPPMNGWSLHCRGRYNSTQDAFLVEEIIGIEIDTDIPTDITFNHPSFIQVNKDGGQSGQGYKPEYSETLDPEIEDDATASNQQGIRILNGNESWVSFIKPLEIKKKGTVQITGQKTEDGNDENELDSGHLVSTDEAHSAGDLPAADVGGKKDYTNYDQKYANRYDDFNSMIKILQSNHQCKLHESITHELIKIGRSQCHAISRDKLRTIKFVHLSYQGHDFLLIELDTSDGIKSISTKLVYLTLDDWKIYLDDIKKHLVAKSLSWPNVIFDEVFGSNAHTHIVHPRHSSSESDSSESVNSWANRIINELNRLL
ncbi:MAG: hypothetical protein KGO49_05245 [Gammaproteobacteria bacterium]|nr:hypothetical protein [Gammaproteobacteria bacterium]